MRRLAATLLVLFGFFLPTWAVAEQFKQFGDIVIHYQAVNTKLVDAAALQQYGISVSRNNAVINIAVQQQLPDGSYKPLTAKVAGSARNLLQQRSELRFVEVKEGSAVYYLSQLRYTPEQTFHIEVDTTLADGRQFKFSFPQTFYVEDETTQPR